MLYSFYFYGHNRNILLVTLHVVQFRFIMQLPFCSQHQDSELVLCVLCCFSFATSSKVACRWLSSLRFACHAAIFSATSAEILVAVLVFSVLHVLFCNQHEIQISGSGACILRAMQFLLLRPAPTF